MEHAFHAGFDRLIEELEGHPRVHVAALHRGVPRDPSSIAPRFVERFGIAPGRDLVAFYAARDGCALLWLDREDERFDPERFVRTSDVPTLARIDDLAADTLHAIVMPPLDRVLGPEGIDYACTHAQLGAERERYDKSYVGFDFPGDYYTPALTIERGAWKVQVGDDHGVFEDGRPTVPLDDYLFGVLATKGSIAWRNDLFGLGMQSVRAPDARRDLRGWFAAHPLTIEDLLPPTRTEKAAIAAREAERAAAMPESPRLRALVEAMRLAKSVTRETQKDGRTLVRVERADGGKQLTFLTKDELGAIDRALA